MFNGQVFTHEGKKYVNVGGRAIAVTEDENGNLSVRPECETTINEDGSQDTKVKIPCFTIAAGTPQGAK